MASERPIYVFAPTPQGYKLAGRAFWSAGQGTFEYAADWLNDAEAYALDPRNLRLSPQRFITRANQGVFGVLADAGPDSWGRRVIDHVHKQRPSTPLEYLVSGNGDGVGALRFSLSRSALPARLPRHVSFRDLNEVAAAERDLDEGKILDDERLQKVWEAGSSMGGARPKFTVGEGHDAWLVKLPRRDDPVNMAIMEHACLLAGREAGLVVPDSDVVTIGAHTALMVRRFDRPQAEERCHYLSAHALLNLETIKPQDCVAPTGLCTYAGIASYAQHAMGLAVGPDLFRRMAFNLALGNTDDHGRNLGFLKPLQQGWQLAPAFDLTVIGGTEHALGLGREGRRATVANLLSDLPHFRVSEEEARATWKQVVHAVNSLPELMVALGAPEADVRWVKQRAFAVAHPETVELPVVSAPARRRQRQP